MGWNDECPFNELLGKTLIEISGLAYGSEEVIFTCDDGTQYKMLHYQDCCESVTIDDVCGDVSNLINSPITMAEESSSNDNPDGVVKKYQDSFTWTFYKLATIKGFVDIKWYGESNGYYSESVNFEKIK